jgi:hypothetical protein
VRDFPFSHEYSGQREAIQGFDSNLFISPEGSQDLEYQLVSSAYCPLLLHGRAVGNTKKFKRGAIVTSQVCTLSLVGLSTVKFMMEAC